MFGIGIALRCEILLVPAIVALFAFAGLLLVIPLPFKILLFDFSSTTKSSFDINDFSP